jgi:hypothetical protein
MTYAKQLRFGDMLRFGEGVLALDTSFGTNSLMLGVVSPATRLDLLDSALEISQLGCSSAGYNRTATVPFESSSRIQLNSAAFLVSTNFSPTASANPGFSINNYGRAPLPGARKCRGRHRYTPLIKTKRCLRAG